MTNILANQLRRMEEAMADPEVRKSASAMSRILHPEFKEIGASGRIFTYKETLEILADENDFVPYKINNFQTMLLRNDTALVTYQIPARQSEGIQKHGSHRSSIWMLIEDEWRIRFHQGTKIPL